MTVFDANPLIVALDVDTAEEALGLARLLKQKVGGVKVGPRLMVRFGAQLSLELAKICPVFIDNKYLDIPTTMDAAVRASFDAGATLVTVHAWAGSEALRLLAQTEAELNAKRPFKILAVTILTSFTSSSLPPPLSSQSLETRVLELAELTFEAGLAGIVCSPHEVEAVRSLNKKSFLVTPGVRLATDEVQDQKRVLTPAEAMAKGSSALVIGRPLLLAKDPVAKAEEILLSLNRSLNKGLP